MVCRASRVGKGKHLTLPTLPTNHRPCTSAHCTMNYAVRGTRRYPSICKAMYAPPSSTSRQLLLLLLSSQAFIVIISLEWSLYQVSFGLLRFLSVPPFNFLFISSTSIIVSHCFSIVALFCHAISSLVALNLSLYLSQFLPFLRLFAGLRFLCAPGYGKAPSARLLSACRPALISIKLNPPTSHNRPRSSQGHRLVPLLCYCAKLHARATIRSLLSESLRLRSRHHQPLLGDFRRWSFHYNLPPQSQSFRLDPVVRPDPDAGPSLSPCAHRVTLSSRLSTHPVGPLSCQTLGGTGTYCHRPPTLHLDRPTSVQHSS